MFESRFRLPVKVQHGDFRTFVAAHKASNFGATATNTPRQRAAVAERPPGTLGHNLTVQELKLVERQLNLHDSVTGAVERHDIERVIESRLGVAAPEQAIAALPPATLRAILGARDIPHGSAIDQQSLVSLVDKSARGSCWGLPVGVLRSMLRQFGHGQDAHVDLEKHDLARRVMAARVMSKTPTAAAAAARRSVSERVAWSPPARGSGDDPAGPQAQDARNGDHVQVQQAGGASCSCCVLS